MGAGLVSPQYFALSVITKDGITHYLQHSAEASHPRGWHHHITHFSVLRFNDPPSERWFACGIRHTQTTNTSVAVGEYNNITGQWNCGLANGAGVVYCLDATDNLLWQSGESIVYDAVNDMNQTAPCSCYHTVDEFCAWAAAAADAHEAAIKTSFSTLRADVKPHPHP